jgi:hypothetical protein
MTAKPSGRKSSRTIVNHHKPLLQSLSLVLISLGVSLLLYQLGWFHQVLNSLHGFGYIGAFVAGIFFVSVFTAAPAVIVLLMLAETLPVLPLVLVAGAGSVVGDMLILTFLHHSFNHTLSFFPKEKGIQKIITTLRHTKYRFLLTVIGAIVIASPLPDELGLTLMGITNIHPFSTIGLIFVCNTVGLWLLLSVIR